jgi:hypothetical protein
MTFLHHHPAYYYYDYYHHYASHVIERSTHIASDMLQNIEHELHGEGGGRQRKGRGVRNIPRRSGGG